GPPTGDKRGTPCVSPTVFVGRAVPARGGLDLLGDGCRQLEPRADAELLVSAAEVALDGLLGHEEGLGDLSVRSPLGRLPPDAPRPARGPRRLPGAAPGDPLRRPPAPPRVATVRALRARRLAAPCRAAGGPA